MRNPVHCLLLLWLLFASVWAAVAAAEDWPDPARLDDAVTEALADKQTELRPRAEPDGDVPAPPLIAVSGGMLGGFFELLAYVLLAAGVVLVITLLLQKFGVLDRGKESVDPAAAEEVEFEPAIPSAAPDAAVAAAARGEFDEALRLLLGEVLPRFYRGHGAGWPEAWTSRQCLRRVVRAEPAREQLAGLIGAVERHHFGGLPARRSDWEHWEGRTVELSPSPPVKETP